MRALTNATSAGCTGSSNNANSDSRPSSPSVADVTASAEPRTKDVAVQSSLGDRSKRSTGPRNIAELVSSEDSPTPDPALIQQLWQEFNERAQAQRAIDRDEYHRKMQRKYNERKALREHVARLEHSLADSRRERDDLLQRLGLESADGYEEAEVDETSSPVPSPHRSPIPSPRLSPRASIAPPSEFGHLERSFQLERALADTKQQLVDTEELLSERQTAMQGEVDDLKARLELERRANTTLARQLRETINGFQITADELVDTRLELEKEQIARRMDSEQFQEHIQQLLAQHRQVLVVADAKQALRNLGRQALHEKVKAFHSRAMVAEQRMRAAQEEALRLQQEVNSKQCSLEQLMSTQALGPVSPLSTPSSVSCLADTMGDNSEDGIVLFHGTKAISGRTFLLHVVCDDDTRDTSEDAEAFHVHFVAFGPVSGQHDCITFRLPDIRRLVMDSHTYLAKDKLGRRHRLSDLAALLLPHVHAGYKSGRLVLCELPSLSSTPPCAGGTSDIVASESQVLREVVAYRGTRFIECCGARSPSTVAIMADLTVNEFFSTQSPQHWWIEIHAVLVDGFLLDGAESWDLQEDYVLKVDHQRLLSLCDQFGGYRPTDRLDKLPPHADHDRSELMAVHEAMLWPLLDCLRVFISADATNNGFTLRLGISGDSAPSEMAPIASVSALSSVGLLQEPIATQKLTEDDAASRGTATTNTAGRTLDHQCIVNVGGVFYCARFLELWDDELLLEVTLDDPESSVRVTGLLRERHLAAIATYLHERGAVAEDFASQLEFSLATELQAPLCKLLTKHLRRDRIDRHSPFAVSFTSLFREIGFVDDGTGAGGSVTGHEDSTASESRDTAPSLESTAAQPVVPALELRAETGNSCIITLGCRDMLSEQQIHDLVLQIKTQGVCRLRQSRRGVRLRDESGRSELALLRIYDGFTGFDGVAAVIFPLLSSGDTSGPEVVVVNEPLGPRALELLGVERCAE